ncbi:MAG: ATP-binding protein [Sinobacteraceae bacterium]|nr:ATP-binding protein [Nevskiaceae bacterium]
MKAHRHLRLVWPPPIQHFSLPGRSIAVMGAPGVGKTALVIALAGELLWRDERLVLVDAAAASTESLRVWVEAGRPGIFDDVPLICRPAEEGARAAVEAVAEGGTALIDVGPDISLESAAAICQTVRLTIYVRRRSNDHDGDTVTAKALEDWHPRRGFKVLYNGLRRDDSLRALRTECCRSGIGSFGVALSERVAYRTGRYTGKPPAFQSAGSRVARHEIARLADAIDRHFEHIAMLDRWQAESAAAPSRE